jgi:hypothetical protein
MTLRAAAEALKSRNVTVTTTRADVTGVLRVVGDDFIDVEYKATKSTLIPFTQLVSIKEN